MSINYAILDLDGVLADFVGAMCRAHGRESPYHDESPWLGRWDLAEAWGMSNNEFWSVAQSREWWAEIEPTEEYEEIIDLVESYYDPENIAVCTARSVGAAKAGTVDWIQRWMPDYRKRLITTPSKHFLRPDALLIDDAEFNVEAFSECGGHAFLFPRPWNWGWTVGGRPYNVMELAKALELLKEAEAA